MSLDQLVQVSISTQTTGVSQAGFGVPLVCAYHTVFPERVRSYTSLAGMVSDGFAVTDAAYLIAQALIAQNPKLPTFKVGRRALAPTMIVDCTPTAQNDTDYTVTINGTDFTYTSDADALVSEITAGLLALVNAGAEPVTATDGGTELTLTADVPGDVFTLELSDDYDGDDLWYREDVSTDPGIATDLAAIVLYDADWYGLCLDSQSSAEIVAAATWTESNSRLFGATTGDSEVPTSGVGDVATSVSGSNRARTFLTYDKHPHDRAAEAWMGAVFPKDPGSATWMFKTPSGPTARIYTATQVGYLEAKSCNFFSPIGGVDIMQNGVTAAGEFIDITRGIDWFKARAQERIYGRLVNLDKIKYTNAGVGVIESELRAQLNEGIRKGLLAASPAPTVTVPDVADVSSANKIARILPDVAFEATLAGAIHKVVISGVVSA